MNLILLLVSWSFLFSGFIASAQDDSSSTRDVPEIIGSKETANWDKTTLNAAKTKEHEELLKKAKVATIMGEVVDTSCYLQMGRRGPDHVACGIKCILNGQAPGLVDEKGQLYFLFPEQHDPRRDGEISLRAQFSQLVGKRVEITGMLAKRKDGYKALFIKTEPMKKLGEPKTN